MIPWTTRQRIGPDSEQRIPANVAFPYDRILGQHPDAKSRFFQNHSQHFFGDTGVNQARREPVRQHRIHHGHAVSGILALPC